MSKRRDNVTLEDQTKDIQKWMMSALSTVQSKMHANGYSVGEFSITLRYREHAFDVEVSGIHRPGVNGR